MPFIRRTIFHGEGEFGGDKGGEEDEKKPRGLCLSLDLWSECSECGKMDKTNANANALETCMKRRGPRSPGLRKHILGFVKSQKMGRLECYASAHQLSSSYTSSADSCQLLLQSSKFQCSH